MARPLALVSLVLALLGAVPVTQAPAAPGRAAPVTASCRTPDGERNTCFDERGPFDLGLVAPAGPDHAAGHCVPVQAFDDRCEAWTSTYDSTDIASGSHQFPAGLALSPDGHVAYVAIKDTSFNRADPWDTKSRWTVVAEDVATGAQRWVIHWGSLESYSFPAALTVSADGATVYVAGSTRPSQTDTDSHFRLLALDATTGSVRWTGSYDGPGDGYDNAMGVVASADGRRVYAAIVSDSSSEFRDGFPVEDLDMAVVGFDTATGAAAWSARYASPTQNAVDSPFGFGISPDGSEVFVTGWSYIGENFDVDYATVAYDTATGKERWVARYDGVGMHGPDEPFGLAVSPDGRRVYVTGMSNDGSVPFAVSYRYATVAYDAATGQLLWEASYHPAGFAFNAPNDIAVSQTGDRVFVTGQINKSDRMPTDVLGPRLGADNDFGTVAYDGSTGQQLWSADLGTPGFDFEFGLGVAASPDGSAAYVTGVSSSFLTSYALARSGQLADQTTVAYDGATGAQRWIGRLNATGYDFEIGFDVEVTADGGTVVTDGQLEHEITTDDDPYDVGIAAYRTA